MQLYPRGFGRVAGHSVAIAAAVMVASVSETALAAAVSPQAGVVYVDAGSGFFPVQGTTYVAPGSKVMVAEGGSAYLAFSAACATTIAGPSTVEVPADPPCLAGQSTPPPGWQQPAAAAAASTGLAAETIVVGGLVVAAGAGAALALSGGGDSGKTPASP